MVTARDREPRVVSGNTKAPRKVLGLPEEVLYHPLLSRTFEAVIDGRVIAGLRRSKGSDVAMR